MEHLHIETSIFIKLYSDEGYFITSYKEGDDIKEYSASTILYCPLTFDTSIYRVIDAETNERYLKEQEEYYKNK